MEGCMIQDMMRKWWPWLAVAVILIWIGQVGRVAPSHERVTTPHTHDATPCNPPVEEQAGTDDILTELLGPEPPIWRIAERRAWVRRANELADNPDLLKKLVLEKIEDRKIKALIKARRRKAR